jgi:hypothetical protein
LQAHVFFISHSQKQAFISSLIKGKQQFQTNKQNFIFNYLKKFFGVAGRGSEFVVFSFEASKFALLRK